MIGGEESEHIKRRQGAERRLKWYARRRRGEEDKEEQEEEDDEDEEDDEGKDEDEQLGAADRSRWAGPLTSNSSDASALAVSVLPTPEEKNTRDLR